jgi:hypothetical protein
MSDPNAPQEGLSAAQPPAAPQPPGPPYGQPPAAPQPPGPPSAPYAQPDAPYGQPFAPAPVKKSKAGKIIGIIAGVVVVLLLICGVGAYFALKDKVVAVNANEGDCLSGDAITGTTSTPAALKLTRCDAADARYKVVGKIPDKKRADADQSLCQPFVPQGAEVIYWQEKSVGAGVGSVLCLAPAK